MRHKTPQPIHIAIITIRKIFLLLFSKGAPTYLIYFSNSRLYIFNISSPCLKSIQWLPCTSLYTSHSVSSFFYINTLNLINSSTNYKYASFPSKQSLIPPKLLSPIFQSKMFLNNKIQLLFYIFEFQIQIQGPNTYFISTHFICIIRADFLIGFRIQ